MDLDSPHPPTGSDGPAQAAGSTEADPWELRALPPATDLGGGYRVVRSAVYGAVDGYRPLEVDLHVAGDAPRDGRGRPAVVWVHGGAWLNGSRFHVPAVLEQAQMYRAVAERGYLLASVDYRHAAEAPFPAQLHDVKAAVRWLRRRSDELGVDPDRIAVWGESAGGHLAALVALTGDAEQAPLEGRVGLGGASSGVRAAVAWYPVTDLTTLQEQGREAGLGSFVDDPGTGEATAEVVLLGGRVAEVPALARAASPVAHARADAPPLLVQHGTADATVPVAQSDQLVAALREVGAPVEYDRVDGYDHCFEGHPQPAALVRQVLAFLDRHLR